ncbi:DUF1446 domain-containing protein [Hyphomonas sp. WL0036]|uniref:acyclic terpene utilization AtuA family protein n=1 Tax=Hyphomonas sediminis TaxID=2866160 RepID=UPI001C7E8DC5|nr:acyclic terpene utilization AtuA family protein [Hyphomonas sediminis]MBY9068148.1 DUF1446 domain-containing protein [Hyphomonas sediminis]
MKKIFIAGGSGFWGDSDAATAQLLNARELDYIVYDYLSEITLALLARAREADPDKGFIPDFERAITPHLATIKSRGVKLLANAGGLNPVACARALEARVAEAGLQLKIAAVTGDDVLGRIETPATDMFTNEALAGPFLSANAYLGIAGIVAALETGADIVVTGRCADSALTLAPLVHEFGWRTDDWDQLSQGSLAGHLIECGCQGAGGLFTDWDQVPGWDDMGFPVAVCEPDGRFEITKLPGTGGLISPLSVAEQMLYEIGDPSDYRLPDVICDFRDVQLELLGPDRVRVSGARGRAAPMQYKASVTWQEGWRLTVTLMIGGCDAAAKARRTGQAILDRAMRLGAEKGLAPFSRTSVEVLGAEDSYGPHARTGGSREVVLKIAVAAESRAILDILSREIFPSATAMAPGITGVTGGRPKSAPVIRGSGVLVARSSVPVTLHMGTAVTSVPVADIQAADLAPPEPLAAPHITTAGEPFKIAGERLLDCAVARSGDKGDLVNVGVIARDEVAWAFLRERLSASIVAEWLDHLGANRVERFELPGSRSLNFVLHGALDGGGMRNLRFDAQGKAVAQILLDMPLEKLIGEL